MTFYVIESFRNGLGQIRFRFVCASVLHPGKVTRSLRCWATRDAARKAARRSGLRGRVR